jgi:hypothetical protein
MTDIVGPIGHQQPVLAFCSNDAMLRVSACNWMGIVWSPNPFYHLRCPICNSHLSPDPIAS